MAAKVSPYAKILDEVFPEVFLLQSKYIHISGHLGGYDPLYYGLYTCIKVMYI